MVFGPNFVDLPQCPKYTKPDINQPSDGLYVWVWLHLMWDIEFNIWNYFLRIDSDIWGIWVQFPRFNPVPKYSETGITRPSVGLYPWVRVHLMRNVELNTLNDFPCISAHDLRYLGLFFLTCPNSTKTLKQVWIGSQMALRLEPAFIWCEI